MDDLFTCRNRCVINRQEGLSTDGHEMVVYICCTLDPKTKVSNTEPPLLQHLSSLPGQRKLDYFVGVDTSARSRKS